MECLSVAVARIGHRDTRIVITQHFATKCVERGRLNFVDLVLVNHGVSSNG